MKFALAGISLLALVVYQGQAPLRTSGARIEGTVLRNGNDDPIRGARVILTRINSATGNPIDNLGGTSITTTGAGGATPIPGGANVGGRGPIGGQAPPNIPPPSAAPEALPVEPVVTDVQGHFVFPELQPGSYRLSVAANGYVRQEYGQRIFPGQGVLLNLAAGQAIRGLVVRLTQTGNVSGRITDINGQLAVGAPVQLLKVVYNAIGQRTFQDGGSTRTNDRGEYRIFWVTPGRYYIAAGTPTGPAVPAPPASNESLDRYSYTFFPGVAESTRASAIEVQSGGESSGDFPIQPLQFFHVRGRVADANGRPPASISVSFAFQTVTGQVGAFSMGQIYDPATGNFDVPNVMPGAYVVQLASNTVERMAINVVNANVENLSFVLGSGTTLNGRLRTDSPASGLPPGADRVRVQLRGLNFAVTLAQQNADADGNFRIENIPAADYRVVVTNLPVELYAKDVRLGGFDLMTQILHVTEGSPIPGTLDVILSPNVSQIEGSVLDDRGQPIPGIQAVLVPDRNRDHAELFKTATTDQTGHYSIKGIPPGDYKLFAWESLETFGYFDPDLMKKSDSQGKVLHITDSMKLSQDIRSIRATP